LASINHEGSHACQSDAEEERADVSECSEVVVGGEYGLAIGAYPGV